VISFKGDVYYKAKDQQWKKVKQGEFLTGDDVLKVKKNLYITLFDKKNQQYLVINGERTIRIKDTYSKPNNIGYTSLVDVLKKAFDDFTSVFNPSLFDSQAKTKLRATTIPDKFYSISPRKTKIYSETIIFRWLKHTGDSAYRFILLDENFITVLDTLIFDNYLQFDKTNRKLEKGHEYIWRVYIGKDIKEFKELSLFKFVDDEQVASIKKNIDSLDILISDKSDPTYFVLRGLVFENQLFFSDALENYLKAIELNSNEEKYKFLVDRLFEKMNLSVRYSDVYKK
jgi:hypothetical protein